MEELLAMAGDEYSPEFIREYLAELIAEKHRYIVVYRWKGFLWIGPPDVNPPRRIPDKPGELERLMEKVLAINDAFLVETNGQAPEGWVRRAT
jgi:hypothetical protein